MEGLDDHENTGGNEKNTNEAVPVEAGEGIKEIEATNPHDNSKGTIKIQYNKGGDYFYRSTFINQDKTGLKKCLMRSTEILTERPLR